MKTQFYEWQGEPVNVEFGVAKVTPCKERKLTWYNYNCYTDGDENNMACIDAIKVTTKDNYSFVISNQFGEGVNKLTNGGWPNIGHASLPLESFTHEYDSFINFNYSYNEADHKEYLDKHRAWMKERYPEDMKFLEGLESIISKGMKARFTASQN